MHTTKSNIRLINLSNYSRPKIVEVKNKNWVLNGKNNSFYQYIIDRYNGSTTNASIINSYIDLIYGKGLSAINTNTDQLIKLKSVILSSDIRMIVSDFQLFGEASMQIIRTKGGDLSSIKHVPKHLVVPSLVNDDNEIDGYWVSKNWSKINQNPPEYFSSFGTSKDAIEIYNIKPYKAGKMYFSDPDYISGITYAEVEEELSNLYINSIKQGLSAGYIINIKEGKDFTSEEKDNFEKAVKQRLAGSPNASNFIISFNGSDVEVTIEQVPINDNVHKQWGFLTEEAKQQILTSHRATSPSLVGLISSSGFSNTADEMDKAEEQLMKRVIRPKQNYIIDAFEEVLFTYGINLQLYFKPLTEKKENLEEKKTSLSKQNLDVADALITLGEDEDLDDYYIYYESEVDYDEKLEFASTGVARPNLVSKQDSRDILIRYRYVGDKNPQREFCRKMMSANKIYRKEDIVKMKNIPVNKGWGLNGEDTYSIWLYKGGGNCYHKWNRVIYVRKGIDVDVNSPLAQTISTAKARQKGYSVPKNESEVSIAPINMPNNGFVNK